MNTNNAVLITSIFNQVRIRSYNHDASLRLIGTSGLRRFREAIAIEVNLRSRSKISSNTGPSPRRPPISNQHKLKFENKK